MTSPSNSRRVLFLGLGIAGLGLVLGGLWWRASPGQAPGTQASLDAAPNAKAGPDAGAKGRPEGARGDGEERGGAESAPPAQGAPWRGVPVPDPLPPSTGDSGQDPSAAGVGSRPTSAARGLEDEAAGGGAAEGEGEEAGGAAGVGALTDRTGENPELTAQINREFMPLASECIDMATERDPELAGLLSVAVNLVPHASEDGQALVESVVAQADNTLVDPELLECIEQSTLSIDGLDSDHSFSITMPIGAEVEEREGRG